MTGELRRLRRATDALTPRVAVQVERALARLRAAVSERELVNILLRRDAIALHDLVASLPIALRPALATLRAAFDTGLRQAVAGIPRMKIGFAAVDADAVRYAERASATLVREITIETRAAIRQVVTDGLSKGHPPRDMARRIKATVGLTRKQAEAVQHRFERLVEQGVSRAQAQRAAHAYSQQLLKTRAMTIARTETIRSSAQGQIAAWRSATNRGLLAPGARKVWITTPDDRLCKFCRPMDGRTANLEDQFRTAFGLPVSAPPLHPNCRCAVAVEPIFTRSRRAA